MWIPFTLPGVYIFFRGRGLFYWRKPQRRTELKAVPRILRVCGVCVCVLSFKCCIPSAFSSQSVQSLLLLSHNQTPTIILSSSTSVTLASIKLVSVNGLFIIQGWLNSIKPISIKLLSIKHTIIRLTSVYLPPGNLSLSNWPLSDFSSRLTFIRTLHSTGFNQTHLNPTYPSPLFCRLSMS